MPDPDRSAYYVDTEGFDVQAIRLGLAWLSRELEKRGGAEGWLVVNTWASLDGTCISEALGASNAKSLVAGRPVRVGSGLLRCRTLGTLKGSQGAAVILAVHGSGDMLDRLDKLQGVKAIAFVPWIRQEAQAWVETWEAQELSGAPAQQGGVGRVSPLVEVALRELTGAVNRSTGIAHPTDHDLAVVTMQALRTASELPASVDLKAWLLRNRWPVEAANALMELAERIARGARPRVGSGFFDPQAMLARWRKQAPSA